MMMPGSVPTTITRRHSPLRGTATFRNRNQSRLKNWKMHILVTADTLGGVWTYTRELVTGLARRGVRVTLVSFGEIFPPEQTTWIDELRGVDYRPTAFKLE